MKITLLPETRFNHGIIVTAVSRRDFKLPIMLGIAVVDSRTRTVGQDYVHGACIARAFRDDLPPNKIKAWAW